ncbi:MAG: hypothetical protein Tsb0026_05010 [Sulfuricaulis sp.]
MDFIYTFLNFLQPGILWPEYADLRPLFIISVIVGIIGFLRISQYPRTEAFRQPAFVYLAFFIIAQVLSVHYSGVDSMLQEIDYWNVYILFVAISIFLINSPAALERYVWGMIVGSMVIVFYGIYAVYAALPAAVGGRAGAYGMYENHNDYSFIIIMVLPFIYMFWRTRSGMVRLFLLFLLLSCVLGMFLSLSRGGILAMVLETGLIVIFALEKEKRFRYLFLISIIGASAIGYQWAAREANQGESYTAEQAEYSRIELWKAGKNMITSKPLLGVGSRRFGELSEEYGEISGWDRGKNAHNTYIEIAATSGLIGFFSFMLMLRSILRCLKTSVTHSGLQSLEPIRTAALISLYAIMFRALFDAKAHDWSFYVLCVIGITYVMLLRSAKVAEKDKADTSPLQNAADV